MPKSRFNTLHKLLALMLCFLILRLPLAVAENDSSDRETVGKVTGVAASATDGGAALQDKKTVHSQDAIATNHSGRARIQLDDGSILGVGSESNVRIVKHVASTGETLLELSAGKLRSRVVKVRKSGTPFQVVTPHARISVIGTDFFLDVNAQRTQVVVYTGIVLVGMKAGSSAVDVAAGQSTIVDSNGISRLGLTAEDYERQTIAETALPGEITASANETAEETKPERSHSHLRRNIFIGAAVAAGALVAGLAARRSSTPTQSANTPEQPSIPSIPPH